MSKQKPIQPDFSLGRTVVGCVLKRRRIELDYSQIAVADVFGIDRKKLIAAENGQASLPSETLLQMMVAWKLNVNNFTFCSRNCKTCSLNPKKKRVSRSANQNKMERNSDNTDKRITGF